METKDDIETAKQRFKTAKKFAISTSAALTSARERLKDAAEDVISKQSQADSAREKLEEAEEYLQSQRKLAVDESDSLGILAEDDSESDDDEEDALCSRFAMASTEESRRLRLRPKKTLPHELLLKHDTVAFVGLTHDTLFDTFMKAIAEEPGISWKSVYICYPADSSLETFISPNAADAKSGIEDLRKRRLVSEMALKGALSGRTDELCFYEVKHHCFFGSWFGWRERGGYIHISPAIWGVNVKKCPSQEYSWAMDADEPGPDYDAYRHGLENILKSGSPFSTLLEDKYVYARANSQRSQLSSSLRNSQVSCEGGGGS